MNELIIFLIQSGVLIIVLKLVYTTGRILQKVDSKLDDHEKRIHRIEKKIGD